MPLSLFHLHGDLKDLRFPRLLAALRADTFTGVIQATTRAARSPGDGDDAGEITREVHFSSGHIAWAISTDRDESLRAFLLRRGTVTEAKWAEAEERAREGTLRQALIGLALVDARELTQIEKGRAEEIVLALFAAREGEYRVRERQLAPGTPDLTIDPRPLILKGVLAGGDRALVLDEIGSLDTVYVVKRPALEESGLSLPGEFQSVLRHIDGKRSIAQICSVTSLPDHFVCAAFAALSMIGAVRRNYEKTHAKARGEIVKGSEVTVPGAPPGEAPLVLPPPELPPISTEPFPGEGPVTRLDARDEDGSQDREVEISEPEEAILEEEEESPAPLYSERGSVHRSRPWFLLGGAAAVGFATLFIVLMAQDPGDAGEGIRPVSQAALQPPALTPAGRDADEEDWTERRAAADEADGPDDAIPPEAPPRAAPSPVATPPGAAILKPAPGGARAAATGSGRESLLSGDYLSAARHFGREVSKRSGDFTIQLLTACQEDTVRRAVETSGGSSSLFILSTRLEGRNCYRVCWGRYPSPARAREALQHEVPASFRQDRIQPRVTRLGGL